MKRDDLQYRIWRAQAVIAKGPAHWLNLARSYRARWSQRALDVWRAEATGRAAFLAQLSPAGSASEVAAHFRSRPAPAFAFGEPERQERARQVSEPARAATLAHADAVLQRRFQFRGAPPVTFTSEVNWAWRPDGNTDWTWELNRHAYFVTLGRAFAYSGDARYVAAFRELLCEWLDASPPGVDAPNWDSPLEVAYRLNVWTWAYYHFRAALDEATLLALMRGLWLHGRFLAANLEHSSPNNHLLLEAKALAQAGLLFPEFRAARHWLANGLNCLWAEVRRQVHPDGVHAEQASLYHQIITSELLELLVLCRHNAVEAPFDIWQRFEAMLSYERALRKPDGEPPLLGDSALGDSYVRFDALAGGAALLNRPDFAVNVLDENTLWLVGPQPAPPAAAAPDSQAFPHGGYYFLRAGDTYLVFDCGPFSYPPAPGHGHADALSFELYAQGQTLIVDPGVYSYHLGADWRNYFRSTAAHNTVTVDGLDQSKLLDNWRVRQPAQSRLRQWLSTDQFDFVDGEHRGYTRLPEPVTHRRSIFFFKPEYFIVLDQLAGTGVHRCDLNFHLTASARAQTEGGLVRVIADGGRGLLIAQANALPAETIAGSAAPMQGWVSRYSGEKQPAPVVRHTQTGRPPIEFITVLYPCAEPQTAGLRVTPLDLGAGVCALQLEFETFTDYFVLDQRPQPRPKAFADFISHAVLTHVRVDRAGQVHSLLAHGGEAHRRGERALDPT